MNSRYIPSEELPLVAMDDKVETSRLVDMLQENYVPVYGKRYGGPSGLRLVQDYEEAKSVFGSHGPDDILPIGWVISPKTFDDWRSHGKDLFEARHAGFDYLSGTLFGIPYYVNYRIKCSND